MAVGIAPPSDHVLHEPERCRLCITALGIDAQLRLRAQNFRTFLPLHSKTVHHARKRQTVLAPFFPRYLFVVLDLQRDQWHAVNGTRGVTLLIMHEGLPAAVRSGVVETLVDSSMTEGEVCFYSDLAPGSRE